MSVNTQTIRIDLNTGRTIPVAFSHQGDTARSFVFEVYNNGEAFSLTGYTAKIAAMLPADNGYRVIAGENMADGTISENTITATLPADFTAKPGRGVLTIVLTGSGATIRPINIDLRIQKSADAAETIAGASDFVPILEQYMAEGMATYINAWLDEHPEAMQYYIAGAKLVLDDDGILSIETDTDEIVAELDIGTLRSEVTDLKSDLESLEGGVLSNEAKTVLLRCFQNVAWINDQGQTYYDSLYAALYPPADLVSIRAAFNQGSAVIFDTDSLDTLKQYLTVTAIMSDSTTRTVTNYTLSGTLTVGTSTITVSYGGKTTTFNVTVTEYSILPDAYQQVEYIESANTGSGPYMIIPVTFPSNFTIKGKTYQAAHSTDSACPVIGAKYTANPSTYTSMLEVGYGSAENRMYFWSQASAAVIINGLYGAPIEFEAKYNSASPYKQLKVVTGQETKTAENTTANNTDLTHLLLFAIDYNPFAGRIYNLTLTNSSDEALIDLVPCYRKADGEIGMYDVVADTFYTKFFHASGTFTKGADV